MSKRRGAAKGSGSGYKNLPNYPKDPKVHSMSAKGMKQPQSMGGIRQPYSKKVPGVKMNLSDYNLNEVGQVVASEWGAECISYKVTTNKVIFNCIECGERFTTTPLTAQEISELYPKIERCKNKVDTDGDGVPDAEDCQPMNPNKQDDWELMTDPHDIGDGEKDYSYINKNIGSVGLIDWNKLYDKPTSPRWSIQFSNIEGDVTNWDFKDKKQAIKFLKKFIKGWEIMTDPDLNDWHKQFELKSGTFQYKNDGKFYYQKLGAYKNPNDGKWWLENYVFKKTATGNKPLSEDNRFLGKFDTKEEAEQAAKKFMKR